MMVWLLAILSVVLFGGMGAAAGLAPAACGLIMLLVALLLSGPLTSLAAMLLPKEFINHPLAAWFPDSMFYMELVLVLFVFYIIFWGTGFWVSSKIDFWLKHVGTELQRRMQPFLFSLLHWERMPLDIWFLRRHRAKMVSRGESFI